MALAPSPGGGGGHAPATKPWLKTVREFFMTLGIVLLVLILGWLIYQHLTGVTQQAACDTACKEQRAEADAKAAEAEAAAQERIAAANARAAAAKAPKYEVAGGNARRHGPAPERRHEAKPRRDPLFDHFVDRCKQQLAIRQGENPNVPYRVTGGPGQRSTCDIGSTFHEEGAVD